MPPCVASAAEPPWGWNPTIALETYIHMEARVRLGVRWQGQPFLWSWHTSSGARGANEMSSFHSQTGWNQLPINALHNVGSWLGRHLQGGRWHCKSFCLCRQWTLPSTGSSRGPNSVIATGHCKQIDGMFFPNHHRGTSRKRHDMHSSGTWVWIVMTG